MTLRERRLRAQLNLVKIEGEAKIKVLEARIKLADARIRELEDAVRTKEEK